MEIEKKSDVATKPAEAKEVENPVNAASGSGEVVTEKVEQTPAAPVEESTEAPPTANESTEANPAAGNIDEDATVKESSEPATEENSDDTKETPEIKLETAPVDFRFLTTNQTSHCSTRYIEYHHCVAVEGEGALECDKFAKYYRAQCLGEWKYLLRAWMKTRTELSKRETGTVSSMMMVHIQEPNL